jgi:hypothetical protein
MGDNLVLYRTSVVLVARVAWATQSTPYHVIPPGPPHGLPGLSCDPFLTYKETVSPPRGSTVSATSH